jgi:hypothetical protein
MSFHSSTSLNFTHKQLLDKFPKKKKTAQTPTKYVKLSQIVMREEIEIALNNSSFKFVLTRRQKSLIAFLILRNILTQHFLKDQETIPLDAFCIKRLT